MAAVTDDSGGHQRAGRFGSNHPGPASSRRRAYYMAMKMKASLGSPPARRTVKTVYDLVADQPFFKDWRAGHLRTLAESARQTWFESDELIFREGDIANRLYLIVAGKVVLEASDGHGRVVLLQTVGDAELLGWSWIFSPYIWHLRARALEPTEAIFFYGTRLRELCEKDHELGYEMFKRVAEVMMQRLHTTRRLLLEQHCPDLEASSDWRPGQH
jgi:CRP/FNR family cyclic AMP-dependent transcriptional regulator